MTGNNITINLLGLKCPMPVLKANKKVKSYKSGDIINFLVDDESAPKDFEIFVRQKVIKF